jgi:hypothetical protein
MWSYCVTFRISDKTVGGQSYSDRYARIMDNARAEDAGFWAETTSFMLVESRLQTGDFSRRLAQGLSAAHDMVVVFDPEDMSACYFGAVENPDVLRGFIPGIKKLG